MRSHDQERGGFPVVGEAGMTQRFCHQCCMRSSHNAMPVPHHMTHPWVTNFEFHKMKNVNQVNDSKFEVLAKFPGTLASKIMTLEVLHNTRRLYIDTH